MCNLADRGFWIHGNGNTILGLPRRGDNDTVLRVISKWNWVSVFLRTCLSTIAWGDGTRWCRLSSGIVCTHGRVGIIPQCIVFIILSYCILFSSGKSVDGRCMPVSRKFSPHFCEQITLPQKYQESVGFNFYKEIIMPTIKVLTKSSLLKYRNIHFCYIFRPLYHKSNANPNIFCR